MSSKVCCLLAVMISFSSGMIGCGSGNKEPMGQVQGKVTRNGTPLVGASIEFISPKSRPAFGITNLDGTYSLRIDERQTGALLGAYSVRITPPFVPSANNPAVTGQPTPLGGPPPEEPKPVSWPTPVEVKAGSNTFDFNVSN